MHALLWKGTAASAVNLNPLGFSYSEAHVVNVGEEPAFAGQVGFGRGLAEHALYWRGTAGSVTNLHSFLPADSVTSRAYSINSTGDIVGTTVNNLGVSQAVLWERFALESLTLNPTTIQAGQGSTGTVRINFPAPPGGAEVWLGPQGPTSVSPVISLPVKVTIPEGARSTTFQISSQFSLSSEASA